MLNLKNCVIKAALLNVKTRVKATLGKRSVKLAALGIRSVKHITACVKATLGIGSVKHKELW